MADQLPEGQGFSGQRAVGGGDEDNPVRLIQGLHPVRVKEPLVLDGGDGILQ